MRERRNRQTEQWETGRDAIISAEVALGRATARGGATPGYAQGERPRPTAESQTAALARLGAMFPGAVTGRDDS